MHGLFTLNWSLCCERKITAIQDRELVESGTVAVALVGENSDARRDVGRLHVFLSGR